MNNTKTRKQSIANLYKKKTQTNKTHKTKKQNIILQTIDDINESIKAIQNVNKT